MRLSDAIMLGDSLKKPYAYIFLSPDNSCGCALGGAQLAAGLKRNVFTVMAIQARWPWITDEQIDAISWRYCSVADGRMSIEDLCAYVRSIEPAEPEPENYEDAEEYWSDADTTREMVNSIKGR